MMNLPTRPGMTIQTTYSCGHTLVKTTNPVVYDPAGVLCETQTHVESREACGHCEKIESDRRDREKPDFEPSVDSD